MTDWKEREVKYAALMSWAHENGLTSRAARIVDEFDRDPARVALLTRGDLRRRENVGKHTVNLIQEWLARHGLHFADYRALQCPHCGKGINIVAKFTAEKEDLPPAEGNTSDG